MFKTFACVFISSLMFGLVPIHAARPKDVKSFVALAPDTVEQGQPFVVTYKLTSSSWEAGARPLSGKGFELKDVNYSHVNGRPYSQLLTKATYTTSLSGLQELPGMTVKVGKVKVKPDKKTIFVKKNSSYGDEMTVAHEWLLKQGKPADSLCLSAVVSNDCFFVFEDLRNRCFCVVAKKELWSLVGEPVLAYSTENYMNIRNADARHRSIIDVYSKQIGELKRNPQATSAVIHPSYVPHAKQVGPLMGDVEWGQVAPYNRFSPTLDGKKTLVGCVPLAVTMMMNYHKWPAKGRSHCYYQDNKDNIYKLDFETSEPQWSAYKNRYEEKDTTTDVDNLSKLLTFIGLSIDANFKSEATSASLNNIKHVMCNNMGYSGRMTYLYDDTLTENLIESIVYRELDQKRPLIVSNNGHAFICDGYRDGFLHYNLGWHGQFSGYYRLRAGNYQLPEGVSNLLLIKSLIFGIEPERNDMSREVTLKEPGTLAQLLTDEEKHSLTSLSVSGPLNSSDIIVLRQLAGAFDMKQMGEWGGSLTELNLENATIVKDKQPYLIERARGGWTHWVSTEGYTRTKTYDFDKMTEKEWKSFKLDIGTKQDGLFYTRTDDNKYWANYNCQKNVIGQQMFANCSSLRSIILPKNIKMIDNYAFFGCVSLQSIRIPEKTESAGKIPFHYCVSLEKISAPRNMSTDGPICEECSPALRQVTRY